MSPTSYRTAPPRVTEHSILAHGECISKQDYGRPYNSSIASLPTFADIEAAAARLNGVAHRTPIITSRSVDERTSATVFFKCENLQRAGAFKFRGAYNAMASLSLAERRRGVVAFSSGNHAAAIALAGQLLRVPRVIVMPH